MKCLQEQPKFYKPSVQYEIFPLFLQEIPHFYQPFVGSTAGGRGLPFGCGIESNFIQSVVFTAGVKRKLLLSHS